MGSGGARAIASRVAGFGLPDVEDPGSVVSDADALLLLNTLEMSRLTGLAVAAMEAGALDFLEGGADELLEHHGNAMLHALALERTLLGLTPILEEAGIDVVVLKGPALAHTLYPDPSWRPFTDIDLFLRKQDWRQACSVLAAAGLRRLLPEPRPRFDERFGKGACHIDTNGLEIDLHRTLALGPFGLWLDPAVLFDHTVPFELGGRPYRMLDPTGVLLHACVHASLGHSPPMLLPVRDVAQSLWCGSVDWTRFEDWCVRWRLRAVAQHAFQEVMGTLGAALPEEARSFMKTEPDASERRALLAYTTGRRDRGGMALSTVPAIGGLSDKVAYLRALTFPRREFVEARLRASGPMAYVLRWSAPLRWMIGKR